MQNEVKPTDTLVSAKGGTLDILRDGVVVAQVPVPAGAHVARDFIAFVPPDFEIQVGNGLSVFAAKCGYHRQAYGDGSHETAANPEFEPTSASRFQAQLDQGLKRLAAFESRIDAKMKARQSVEVIPSPKPDKLADKAADKPDDKVVE